MSTAPSTPIMHMPVGMKGQMMYGDGGDVVVFDGFRIIQFVQGSERSEGGILPE